MATKTMLAPTQILQVVSFLDMFGAGMLLPQLQNQARSLGCSHLFIGTLGATYYGTQLIAGPVIGSLSDLKGRKQTLFMCLCICTCGYFVLGLTSSIVVFFATRACLGFFKHTQLLTKSAAPDYEPDPLKQAVAFGRQATISGIGMSLGPMVSGHVAEAYPEYGFTVLACITAVLFGVNAGLINLLPDKTKEKQGTKKNQVAVAPKLIDSVRNSFKESIDEFYKVDWTVYGDVFLFKLIITLCLGMYFTNYAIFLKTKHDMSPTSLGYIIAFQGGVGSFCSYFIGYINQFYKNDKDATLRTYHIFIAITVSLIGMGLSPNIYLYLLFIIPLAVSGSVGRVSGLEMIMNKGNAEHRGSVIGATSSMRSLSGVVTPLLGGVISEYVGVTYVIFVAALFGATGIVVSYKIMKRSIEAKSKSD
ncbi:major facilitator superfamily domain-containing protein 9-like [Ostrinia nubilalis]|uniref:major facilitator superfamily domain-containing protein 9-like n=1 Tax=Ostrinia nubilalis TaxID=29057 RepID=UPI0030824F2A